MKFVISTLFAIMFLAPAALAAQEPPAPKESAADAGAGASPVVRKVVPSGEERNISFMAALTPDCATMGRIVVRTLEEPRHGAIRFEAGSSYPVFAPDNPRSNCNNQMVAGTKLFYASGANWMGEDQFRILVIYPDGSAEVVRFLVVSR
jgi:hypothetical protein